MQFIYSLMLAAGLLLAQSAYGLEPVQERFSGILQMPAAEQREALYEELAADISALGLQDTIDALRMALENAPAVAEQLQGLAVDLQPLESYALLAALADAGTAVDTSRLDGLLRTAAAGGSAEAQYQLALILLGSDPELSADYLEQAVTQQHAAARREMAFRLQQGEGVSRDMARAERLLLDLRREGYIPAYADLAELYLRGTGTLQRDQDRARGLFALAMDAGEHWAAFRLYQLLLRSGDEKDRAVAARALQQAANAGLIPALIASARWHLLGYLVPASAEHALALLQGAERRTLAAGFDRRGADYYLRRIYLAQAEAALQDGDYAGADNRLQALLEVLQRAHAVPAASRIRDFTALIELGLQLGHRDLVIEAQDALREIPEMSSPVYRDARLAYALQQVLLQRDIGQRQAAAEQLARLRRELKSGGPLLRDALGHYVAALRAMDRGREQSGRSAYAKAIERLAAIGDVPAYLDLYARYALAMSELRGGKADDAGGQLRVALERETQQARVDVWPWALEYALRFARALDKAGHAQAAAQWSQSLMGAFRVRAQRQQSLGRSLLPNEQRLLSDLMVLRGRHLLSAPVSTDEASDDATGSGFFADLALRTTLSTSAVSSAAMVDKHVLDAYLQPVRLRSLRQFMLADQMPDALRPEGLLGAAETALDKLPEPPERSRQERRMPGLLDSAELLSEGEALIVYQLAEHDGLAVVLRSNGLQLVPLYWTLSDPDSLVARVAASLADPGADYAVAAAEKLHELLVSPLQPLLAETGKLLVVPDGRLAEIPLAALRDAGSEESPWLIQRMAVSLLPDMTSLAQMLQADPRGTDYLGIGAPVVPDGTGTDPLAMARVLDWHGRPRANEISRLPRLAGARDRLVRAAALYGDQARLLIGINATEQALQLAQWRRAGVVHFALPALVGGQAMGYLQPALLFGPGVQDGLLSLEEIVARRVAARLVMLDGSDTLRIAGSGQGTMTLAQGFTRAGARSVLFVHQAPDGVTAADFQERFLQHYRGEHAASPALALRMTSLELLYQAGELEQHPRYWAPATLVGP